MVKVIVFIYSAVMLALAVGVITWVVSVIRKKKRAKAEKQDDATP